MKKALLNKLDLLRKQGFDITIEPEGLTNHWRFCHGETVVFSFNALWNGGIVTNIEVDFSTVKNYRKIHDLLASLFKKIGEIEEFKFVDRAAGILKQIEW